MKRILVVLLGCLLVSVGAWAEVVSEAQARKIAQGFRQKGARSVANPTLVYTGMAKSSGARSVDAPTFYVYNYEGGQGFVIVAGDDCAPSVLAYADEGAFVAGEGLPAQVGYWLDTYSSYIEGIRSGARAIVEAPDLGDFDVAVEPLLKTAWDQAEPYNGLCPLWSPTERCATGCAATAIAQVMKYHQWPESGEKTMTHNGIVMDFSKSHYDWDNMLDTYTAGEYTETEGYAVAKLMYDVGMSAQMAYSYESGAQNVHIYRSLYTYFKYSKKARFVSLNSMPATDWTALIRAELEAGRPVYYSGVSEDQTMGHAFVCDGISENNTFFHFNWGWSGHCNGFYSVFMLNPPIPGIGGGQGLFNLDHWAIVGIEPAKEDESMLAVRPVLLLTEYLRTNTSQTSLGRSFPVNIRGIANYGPGNASAQLAIGLYQDGKFQQVVSSAMNLSLQEFRGTVINNHSVTLPKTLKDGLYELRVVVGYDDEWSEVVYERTAYVRSIWVTVQEGKVVIHPEKAEGLDIRCSMNGQMAAGMPSTFLPGKKYPLRATLVNQGELHFNGLVGYRLLKCPEQSSEPSFGGEQDTVVVSEGDTQMFLYGGSHEKQYDFSIRMNEPGEYLLRCYYEDPVSQDEVLMFTSQPIRVEEPAEKYNRQIVVEQLWQGGDHRTMQQLLEAYPNNVIGITVWDKPDFIFYSQLAYVDSLNLPTGKKALMNRVSDNPMENLSNAELYLQEWLAVPAIASVEAKAKYTTFVKDSVEVNLTARFAYSAEEVDMRWAVVSLNRSPIDGGGEGWSYTDMATGFHPSDAWGGVAGSIPSEVKVGEEYTYTINLEPLYTDELMLVALLIDGETGEICNAVSLHQSEIAPASGEVVPTGVNLERTSATMNTGVSVELTATVLPVIASQEIVWTSSNPEVASIGERGVLNALKAGTAVIRAASAVDMEVFAEMTLTVNQADYTQVQQVEAGCLHYLVDFDSCPDKLILGGELNGTDIGLIRRLSGEEDMPVEGIVLPDTFPLHVLDISQCRIVAGGNAYYKEYVTEDNVIGTEMFESRTSLEEVVLPQTVIAIGDNAFAGCTGLKGIEIPASVATIGYASFYGCTGLEAFVVAAENKAFKTVAGVLYNNAGTELVAYPASREGVVYSPEENTTRLRSYAFSYAQYLETFESNLRLSTIDYGAFYQAVRLQKVSLGNRLKWVEEYAFAGCTGLESVFCAGVMPAECAVNAFEGVSKSACILYIADGNACQDYKETPGWDYFTQIVSGAYSVENVLAAVVDIRPFVGGFVVSGIGAGETVSVYNAAGVLVRQVVASGGETVVPLSAPGLYIVRMARFGGKVVVR